MEKPRNRLIDQSSYLILMNMLRPDEKAIHWFFYNAFLLSFSSGLIFIGIRCTVLLWLPIDLYEHKRLSCPLFIHPGITPRSQIDSTIYLEEGLWFSSQSHYCGHIVFKNYAHLKLKTVPVPRQQNNWVCRLINTIQYSTFGSWH